MDEVGTARELIQAYQGPQYDGGAYLYSFGFVSSQIEEE
jgi:hypothetical protein